MAPGADGVQADHVEGGRRVDGLGRLPVPLELRKCAREPGREAERNVVVAGNREYGRAQGAEECGRRDVLLSPPSVRQVAARDDQFGRGALDERGEAALDFRSLRGADVQV